MKDIIAATLLILGCVLVLVMVIIVVMVAGKSKPKSTSPIPMLSLQLPHNRWYFLKCACVGCPTPYFEIAFSGENNYIWSGQTQDQAMEIMFTTDNYLKARFINVEGTRVEAYISSTVTPNGSTRVLTVSEKPYDKWYWRKGQIVNHPDTPTQLFAIFGTWGTDCNGLTDGTPRNVLVPAEMGTQFIHLFDVEESR